MNYKIIIPSRMDSTRLPGKPLKLIDGKPMVWHVYQRALETNIGAENIIIATDSEAIFSVASDFGAQVMMTSSEHRSGTERCAEVARTLAWSDNEIVVNLQGDEPLTSADIIELAASTLSETFLAGIATIACPIKSEAEIVDPNCVKLLTDRSNKAMLFSRSPMFSGVKALDRCGSKINQHTNFTSDSDSGLNFGPWLRHIGIYAYRVWTLESLSLLPETQIEKLERLEQLRAMWHGIHIQVANISEAPGHGVDTPEDLQRVRERIAQLR